MSCPACFPGVVRPGEAAHKAARAQALRLPRGAEEVKRGAMADSSRSLLPDARLRPRSLLAAWLVLASLFGTGLGLPGAPPLAGPHTAAWLLLLALVSGVAIRATLYLRAAREGLLALSAEGPPHALWRLAPSSALVGMVAGGPTLGAAACGAALGAPRVSLVLGALGVVGCVFPAVAGLVRRDLGRTHTPRTRGPAGWLLVDTALPAGLAAALIGIAMAWTRLGHLEEIRPLPFSRHLGATLLLYATLLGPAAALKTGRERLAGLVRLPAGASLPAGLRRMPGPVITGSIMALVSLVVGPHLLPALSLASLLLWKGVLGIIVGGGLALLGALRGASAVERPRAGVQARPPAAG